METIEKGKDLSDSSSLLNAEAFNKGLYFFKHFFSLHQNMGNIMETYPEILI